MKSLRRRSRRAARPCAIIGEQTANSAISSIRLLFTTARAPPVQGLAAGERSRAARRAAGRPFIAQSARSSGPIRGRRRALGVIDKARRGSYLLPQTRKRGAKRACALVSRLLLSRSTMPVMLLREPGAKKLRGDGLGKVENARRPE